MELFPTGNLSLMAFFEVGAVVPSANDLLDKGRPDLSRFSHNGLRDPYVLAEDIAHSLLEPGLVASGLRGVPPPPGPFPLSDTYIIQYRIVFIY